MTYQRSTKATGFKKRTGPDDSKQLRQYAKSLETKRKEDVRDFERVSAQQTQEMKRIDDLATKKDAYELGNLKQFSKTLNDLLETSAKNIVKPIYEQQIEDGITKGIKYQQGDPDVVAEIDGNEEQLREIEKRVNEQELKAAELVNSTEEKWDRENYKASLLEQQKLLNIKKLGGNRALGFRKGILMESATGFPAYRDAALIYNENNPLSMMDIGTEDDPIIIGHYHRYTGEAGFEKRKAILGYITNKYIVEKGKQSGLRESYINKLLTRPILEDNAKYQQLEAKQLLLEESSKSSESNKEAINLGIDGIDADNGEELGTAIQKFLLTEPGNQRGMRTQGSKVVNANDLLVEVLVGEGSKLRTGSHQNVDDQEDILTFLETATFEVPGLTKKGEKKTLSELWPTKFNIDDIRAKLLVETGKLEQERIRSLKHEALGEQVAILQEFHKTRDPKAYSLAVAAMKSNEKYMGILDADFFIKMDAKRDALSYNEEVSREKLKDIRQGYGNTPIPSDHAIVNKLHPTVLAEAEEKGWIAEDLFGGDNEAKASHNSNAAGLLQTIKNGMKTHSPSFTWDDENDQVTAATALIDSTLRKYIKQFLDLNEGNENYSLSDAVADASAQLDKEIKADIAGEVLPTANGGVRLPVWNLQDDGFVNTALNKQYELSATSPLDQAKRIRTIINKTKNKIDLSHHVDIFSDKDQPPIVEADDFLLVEGKVSQIWQQLSQIDPLSRTPEMLYELQASKFPGIEIPEWDDDIKAEIELWNKLTPQLRKQLSVGNFTAGKRAIQEIGVLDLDSTINTLLTQDTDFLISEEELPSILSSLNLESMTLEELKANPQLLKAAMKQKILGIVTEVQEVTTDQNQAIRMVFAGVKFGDINKWDDPYTLAALNAYYSGDRSALNKLESIFNMNPYEGKGINIQGKEGIDIFDDKEISWDVNSIDTEIANLTANMPPPFTVIESNMEGRNWFQNTFNPIKQPNPTYQAYRNRIQALNDRKVFIDIAQNGFGTASGQVKALYAGRRLMGDTRFKELQELVTAKYPDAKINDKTGMIGLSYTDATNMLGALILNEIGAPGSTGNIVGDTSGELAFNKEEYKLGDDLAGNLPASDLVTIKGYQVPGSSKNEQSQTIRIRKDVAPKLENLIDDASKNGIFFNFSEESNYGSGYRTYKGSKKAFDLDPSKAAKPGFSTHNLGAAVDFSFSKDDETAAAQLEWLKNNGPKYGFFPWTEGGKGSIEEINERLKNLQVDDHEFWHWEYRPDLIGE